MDRSRYGSRSTNMPLLTALVGLVATALLVNVGFWAALLGAEAVAVALRVPVLAAALFTGGSFVAGVSVHCAHLSRRRA